MDETVLADFCRREFPLLSRCSYLDTGSAGISFPAQAEAAAAFYADAKSNGYLGKATWQAKAAHVRGRLAGLLDVASEEIEFFSGTTDALNIVGHSVRWQPGDEIVVAEDEFPSVRLSWQAALEAGAQLRTVRIARESEREDALAAAVTDRTRLLVVSHVHSMTGTRLDLDRLGQVCRRHDALFVVDGIHALGAVPASLSCVDAYMAGVFKWMLAGFGLSVCVLRPRIRSQMKPAFRGYLNQPPDDAIQFAHVNYPGLYVLDASMKLLGEDIGWSAVWARTSGLVAQLAGRLGAAGIEVAAPAGSRAGIASFPVPDPEAARVRLAARNIHVAARGPYLRASPFFYNSDDDIARLADAVLEDCR